VWHESKTDWIYNTDHIVKILLFLRFPEIFCEQNRLLLCYADENWSNIEECVFE